MNVAEVCNQIIGGDIVALSKAITLTESTKPEHQQTALEILDYCQPHSGKSIRIAITGVPGVGKSTFINQFGNLLIEEYGKKVAVLAIDPSSRNSHGSILGDKTRMTELSAQKNAFIRPSANGETLGGVASKTQDAIVICEAAGFDVLLVETVGVGQSETMVHNMVDFFLLLLLPGAGDDLQGIKRGIVEMADLIAINKSEENQILAAEALKHYQNALMFMPQHRQNYQPKVLLTDAISGKNLETIWDEIQQYVMLATENGTFQKNRQKQAVAQFKMQLGEVFNMILFQNEKVKIKYNQLSNSVLEGKISPKTAAVQLVKSMLVG